jgi:hypothetical protein
MQKTDWHLLNSIKKIEYDILKNHVNKFWYWDLLAYNNYELVECFPQNAWCFEFLSNNVDLPLDFIKKHINKNWDWGKLSNNNNITIEFIIEHIEKFIRDGNWLVISNKKSLTWLDIKNNPYYPWNIHIISSNKNMFNVDKDMREHMAAFKIQQYWLKAYYNPEYLVCRQRLSREFENLIKV